jgi:hypothetical protein
MQNYPHFHFYNRSISMFHQKEFITRHLLTTKIKAGERYTPELNIELPITELFDGLCRTKKFYKSIREHYGKLVRNFKRITTEFDDEEKILQQHYDVLKSKIQELFKLLDFIKTYNNQIILWDQIKEASSKVEKELWKILELIRTVKEEKKKKDDKSRSQFSERLNSNSHYIYKTQNIIHNFQELSISDKAQLSNIPFMLLIGNAGTGKTHLLCDLLNSRLNPQKEVMPSLLVFGELFSNGKEFWDQVIEQIEADYKSKEDFLRAFDKLGKESKGKALLAIDAINENILHSPNFWKKNLTHIIDDIKKYPNIALVISVRSGFENEVLTKDQIDSFIRVEHFGFRFKEWEAVNKFFTEFSLPLPEIPLLMPEFQNPLFLILFCVAFGRKDRRLNPKGKKKKRQIKPFRGHIGSTHIFESFVLNATKIIANEFSIKKGDAKSPAYRIWKEVIKKIAEEMVAQNSDRVSEKCFKDIIKKFKHNIDINRIIQAFETNMLVFKIPSYDSNGENVGFDIRFPFQKFSDHLIGRYIFKKYIDEFGHDNKNLTTAKKFFSRRRKLGKYLYSSWNRGVVEALSIQCPEQLKGIEFIEAAPYLLKNDYLSQLAEEAFVESLIWRRPSAFSKEGTNTLKIINKRVIVTENGHNNLLNAFLSVAPIPSHPFNAERLHSHLNKFSMAKRDSWWSTFLHYQHGERGALDRLLEWAVISEDKRHIKDGSIYLTAIAVCWLFTTPNRFIRDKATKCLTTLLQLRLQLTIPIFKKFIGVNDPYMIERIFAATYAAILRNQQDIKNLKEVSNWIYENYFLTKSLPNHILIRDYARGIIDTAIRRKIILDIDIKEINPPYFSKWCDDIPTEEELKKKYYPEDLSKEYRSPNGLLYAWFSVMGGGDFARYIIGTNVSICDWSGRKIDSKIPNRKKILSKFKSDLTTKQKELYEKAYNPFFGFSLKDIKFVIKHMDKDGEAGSEEKDDSEKNKKWPEDVEKFETSLPGTTFDFFLQEIKPFLNQRGTIEDPYQYFDLSIAQRWIFQRVVDLGYINELHAKFDDFVRRNSNSGRSPHKSERIGKKYQWIAYHEFMALLSDHFEFIKYYESDDEAVFKGAWNPNFRDIDPSFLLVNDNHIMQSISFDEWRSRDCYYNAWEQGCSNLKWLSLNQDLPNPIKLISFKDDDDTDWIILDGYIEWEEKTAPEYNRFDIPTRQLWYIIKGCIIKKEDGPTFLNWLNKQEDVGRILPDSSEFYNIFIGEYPDSLPFEDLHGSHNIWTKGSQGKENLPVPTVITDISYRNEYSFDCSNTGSVQMKLPIKWLIEEMDLVHKNLDGRYFDRQGNLVIMTTKIFDDNSPSTLLVNREFFLKFIELESYSIVWTLLGEKNIIGNISAGNREGYLDISGIYSMNDCGAIVGSYSANFIK